ncbi:hypothetical protein FGO68_gene5219 [Halteria grandinella]|uniref:Zinc finger PHD-type domain-containing protein n=1 Tax=Halteria grandinella TaxID=5974 RepID=A0A8J8P0Z7_HALGN|nr:hypothetical protein FGO68_gene5219 [Halteria grandinella]
MTWCHATCQQWHMEITLEQYQSTEQKRKRFRSWKFNDEKLLGACAKCGKDADAIPLTQCLFKGCQELFHLDCLEGLTLLSFSKESLDKKGVVCAKHGITADAWKVINEQHQFRLVHNSDKAIVNEPLIESENEEKSVAFSETQDDSISSCSKISVEKPATTIKVLDAVLLPSIQKPKIVQQKSSEVSLLGQSVMIPTASPITTRANIKNAKQCKICEKPMLVEELFTCQSCHSSLHLPCYQSYLLKAFTPSLQNCCVMCIQTSRQDIDPATVACVLCTQPYGEEAMITVSSDYGQWCHLQCATVLSKMGFVSLERVTIDRVPQYTVVWVDNITPQKACSLCLKGEGLTIPCADDSCPKSFHYRCAFTHKYRIDPSKIRCPEQTFQIEKQRHSQPTSVFQIKNSPQALAMKAKMLAEERPKANKQPRPYRVQKEPNRYRQQEQQRTCQKQPKRQKGETFQVKQPRKAIHSKLQTDEKSDKLADKCLGKRREREEHELDEEGVMDWHQYSEYFKPLGKEDLQMLLSLKQQASSEGITADDENGAVIEKDLQSRLNSYVETLKGKNEETKGIQSFDFKGLIALEQVRGKNIKLVICFIRPLKEEKEAFQAHQL